MADMIASPIANSTLYNTVCWGNQNAEKGMANAKLTPTVTNISPLKLGNMESSSLSNMRSATNRVKDNCTSPVAMSEMRNK